VTESRLRNSVIRPLRQLLGTGIDSTEPEPVTQSAEERLWDLAKAATRATVRMRAPELSEATAALQDLAVDSVDASRAAERLAALADLQAVLDAGIELAPNGPYLVTNASRIDDWLGEPRAVRPQMALCRCGGSDIKPLCDGSHASNGFTGAKDPNRVADRRDTYVGQQVTIFDNRGICQHSGLCTDRLATVFRVREEPFVAPSGGRMDEIIRAVRDCPSGALSYAVDGVESRADVDHHDTRPPGITGHQGRPVPGDGRRDPDRA
jgi:uncharacterized Fe-S cluster protein YjdI